MTDPTSVQIVSKSLSAVAKALRDAIDSIAHAVRLRTSFVDALRERQMTAMLYDLINRTKRQLYSQGVVARSFDDFIARQERGQSTDGAYGWEEVRKDIRGNMEFAAEIMETLSAQYNAFAASDAFQPLLEAVSARDQFFRRCSTCRCPKAGRTSRRCAWRWRTGRRRARICRTASTGCRPVLQRGPGRRTNPAGRGREPVYGMQATGRPRGRGAP